MDASSWILGLVVGPLLLAAFNSTPGSDLYQINPEQLAREWEKERISPADPYSLKHADLVRQLQMLAARFPKVTAIEAAGRSVEGREIYLLRIGNGPENILLWSQMHGDEPTASAALMDLIQYMGVHRQEAWIGEILSKYTLLVIPMLNPDGAERMQRRNAQGLDINRDARLLQTPEGRLLKAIRDRYKPSLGFNLHNQNSLTTVGETGRVATIALLAVAAEVPATAKVETTAASAHSGGLLAKKVAAVLYEALSPFVYGHISRYDESYNPRAFGDNLSTWGTPIVLIESGGNPAGKPPEFGIQLNFVGLFAALNSLASGRIEHANPAVFDSLLMNSDNPIFDLMLRNAWICTGTGVPLFRGDIAIRHDMRAGARGEALIADLGDLGVHSAHETIDCTGMMVTPGLITWEPEWSVFGGGKDEDFLERGVTALLETLDWKDLDRWNSGAAGLKTAARGIHWSYVISGAPLEFKPADQIGLTRSLAAGGRAWIVPTGLPNAPPAEITGWFNVEVLSAESASRYRLPAGLDGEPAQVLRRWAAEAAARFHLSRRGTIAVGSVADLVLWNVPAGEAPADLKDCKPAKFVLNGKLVASPEEKRGRFLGR